MEGLWKQGYPASRQVADPVSTNSASISKTLMILHGPETTASNRGGDARDRGVVQIVGRQPHRSRTVKGPPWWRVPCMKRLLQCGSSGGPKGEGFQKGVRFPLRVGSSLWGGGASLCGYLPPFFPRFRPRQGQVCPLQDRRSRPRPIPLGVTRCLVATGVLCQKSEATNT